MTTTATMMAGSRPAVGRKRTPLRGKGKTPREIFSRRLNQLWGDRTAAELAEACGVSTEAAYKWLRGRNIPDIDVWPALAKALGVTTRDLATFD